jgi:hypothetical protein
MTEAELEYAKQMLEQSADGSFVWIKSNSNRAPVGSIAGSVSTAGYIQIALNNKDFYGHRISWAFNKGLPLPDYIDHINGNSQDNRIENLRSVTMSQNLANSKTYSSNKLGVRGVRRNAKGRYVASMTHNQKYIHIGIYSTLDAAIKARQEKAEEIYGEHAAHTFVRS